MHIYIYIYIYILPKQSFSCGGVLTYSPNKALAAEGFLFIFNRIDPADQDFRPSWVAA